MPLSLRTVGILVVGLGAVVTVVGSFRYGCMVGTPPVATQCLVNFGVLGPTFGILIVAIGALLIYFGRAHPVPRQP